MFMDKWQVEVEYVNPAFDIADFYKWSEKFNLLTKMKLLVESYCQQNKMKPEKYKEYV